MSISSVNLQGSDPGEFNISQSPGSPVAPAGTASPDLQIEFCPTSDYDAMVNAQVVINSDASNDPQVVIGLQGTETPP